MKKLFLIMFFSLVLFESRAQQKIILNYEDKVNTSTWRRGNNRVKLLLDEIRENQQNKNSENMPDIRWDSIPANKPWCWFTDLQIDSLANPAMVLFSAEFIGQIGNKKTGVKFTDFPT